MATAVLVPCRLDDDHRADAWRWVSGQYATHHPGWEVVTGTCPPGDWVKALAIDDAFARTDADRLVVSDADVWCDGLEWAVGKLDEFPFVIPHYLVHRLTQGASQAIYDGGPLGGSLTERPYKGYKGGGIVCLRREAWETAPMDPRFQGWGNEDEAWHLALSGMCGLGIRGKADLWHLWHPPQERKERTYGSDESLDLLNRYQRARTRTDMAALLAEVTDERSHRAQPPRRAGAPSLT